MPKILLPFAVNSENQQQYNLKELLERLPSEFRAVCEKNPHLGNYLTMLPLGEIGIPEFRTKLSRADNEREKKNFIYPVADNIFIHILSSTDGDRDNYIPIEPGLGQDMGKIMDEVEERLLNMSNELDEADTDEAKKEALLKCLTRILNVRSNGYVPPSNGRVYVTPEQMETLKYLLIRDKLGLGVLEPLIKDTHIEDISCSGVGQIFVEHKIFKSLKAAITFETHEDLDEFVLRLSEHIKIPVTLRKPIVDATLPDGSRINIVFGRDISRRGSNFTIRKFADTPLSILELIEFGSLSYEMAAYLSLVIEEGMNVFVVGETASGKTTLLNALTTFIQANKKIVSIEDTPELQVPHANWLREVAKAASHGEAQVTMFDLLKAALRQRPNWILIGEIRGEEGNIAFGAMQTGHSVMSTFHASSVEKVIQRITGNPINVPKTHVDNLNVVVCQNAVRLANGKMARRATSISEIVNYDSQTDSFNYIEVFRWNPATDTFEFIGNKNSYLLEDKIAIRRGIPPDKKWQIYSLVSKRAKILERLHKEKGVTNFYELLKIIAQAQQEGLF
ncbi:MAG: type II/IV secretion system ATPase subunit [Dehalococcoidales bacterium]|jgi:flagellar protein FlaI|nr:type II/IV secretion system ATPase subunit [Dehalococcoidales bacterium]